MGNRVDCLHDTIGYIANSRVILSQTNQKILEKKR